MTDVNATHNIANTYVMVLVNLKKGDIAAMRFSAVNTKTNAHDVPPEQFKQDLASFGESYARTLDWDEADTIIKTLGPMTPRASRVIYDAIPGSRITKPQADRLFKDLAKTPGIGNVVNLRRATDKDADN